MDNKPFLTVLTNLEPSFPGATPPPQGPPGSGGGPPPPHPPGGHRMSTPVGGGSMSLQQGGPPHLSHPQQAPGPMQQHGGPPMPPGPGGGGGPGMPPHMMPPHHERDPNMPPGMMTHGPPMHHPHPYMQPHRVPPYMSQPDYRIFEINKRLQQRTDDCDNLWWDSFATEFFEDDATLTLSFVMDDGPKRYTIGRTLIPRYFRSIFESGCSELYYMLRVTRESFHTTSLSVDSEQASMVMTLTRPLPSTVVVEGRLLLEFTFDDLMRIRAWNFQIRTHREMVLRSMLSIQDPNLAEQLSKSLTRNGVTNNTLNFFRLCMILEPMQELMSRQKAYSLTPRDCLKTTLFQKWQRMVAPPGQPQKTESARPASKRRKRKGSTAASEGGGSTKGNSKRKQSPAPPVANMAQPGDVMVVGEPTLMGGEFGDEDERLITRLENSQFDANANNTSIRPPPLPPPPTSVATSEAGPTSAPPPPRTNGKASSRPKSNGAASASPRPGKGGGGGGCDQGTNGGGGGGNKMSMGHPCMTQQQSMMPDLQHNPGSAPPSVCGPGSNGPPPHSAPGSVNGTPGPMTSVGMMMPMMSGPGMMQQHAQDISKPVTSSDLNSAPINSQVSH